MSKEAQPLLGKNFSFLDYFRKDLDEKVKIDFFNYVLACLNCLMGYIIHNHQDALDAIEKIENLRKEYNNISNKFYYSNFYFESKPYYGSDQEREIVVNAFEYAKKMYESGISVESMPAKMKQVLVGESAYLIDKMFSFGHLDLENMSEIEARMLFSIIKDQNKLSNLTVDLNNEFIDFFGSKLPSFFNDIENTCLESEMKKRLEMLDNNIETPSENAIHLLKSLLNYKDQVNVKDYFFEEKYTERTKMMINSGDVILYEQAQIDQFKNKFDQLIRSNELSNYGKMFVLAHGLQTEENKAELKRLFIENVLKYKDLPSLYQISCLNKLINKVDLKGNEKELALFILKANPVEFSNLWDYVKPAGLQALVEDKTMDHKTLTSIFASSADDTLKIHFIQKVTKEYLEEVVRKNPNGRVIDFLLDYVSESEILDDYWPDLKKYIKDDKSSIFITKVGPCRYTNEDIAAKINKIGDVFSHSSIFKPSEYNTYYLLPSTRDFLKS